MVHFLAVAYRTTERTEARRAETRERIVSAALELIAEGGYVAAQIAAVAERAGVAVGTVYRYFPSKSDLFAEVFRVASQREVDAMRAGAAATRRLRRRADRRGDRDLRPPRPAPAAGSPGRCSPSRSTPRSRPSACTSATATAT